MDQNPDVGACGSRLLNPNGTLQTSCSLAATVWSELYRLLYLDNFYPLAVYRMHSWSTSEPRLVDNVQGAALLLRRRVIETVGVLDDRYFMYTEEVNLCRRIRVAGWKIYWVPQSRVIHYGGQSSKQIAAEMFLHLYLSKLMYIRKHYGQRYGSLYKFVLFVVTLARLLLSLLTKYAAAAFPNRDYSKLTSHYRKLLIALPRL